MILENSELLIYKNKFTENTVVTELPNQQLLGVLILTIYFIVLFQMTDQTPLSKGNLSELSLPDLFTLVQFVA